MVKSKSVRPATCGASRSNQPPAVWERCLARSFTAPLSARQASGSAPSPRSATAHGTPARAGLWPRSCRSGWKPDRCAACTIGCEHIYAAPGGPVRLEYESLFALGPLCGISDRDVTLEAARRCDELGLDTISAGATIAFAMECAEKGLIREPGLRFGNGEALLSLLERIAQREGLGDLLAEGTRRAAEVIGGEALDFAPHVTGLEMPRYE